MLKFYQNTKRESNVKTKQSTSQKVEHESSRNTPSLKAMIVSEKSRTRALQEETGELEKKKIEIIGL